MVEARKIFACRLQPHTYSFYTSQTDPPFCLYVLQVAKLVASSCTATLTAFISPYLADRALARKIHEESKIPFLEVFVDAPLEEVEKRDPKGLYAKARAGIIKGAFQRWRIRRLRTSLTHRFPARHAEFTGITAPYEAPEKPELHIKTAETSIEQGVALIVQYLEENKFI